MLTVQEVKMVAATADVDVRTVERALESGGAKVRSAATRKAIGAALRKLGHVREAKRVDPSEPVK